MRKQQRHNNWKVRGKTIFGDDTIYLKNLKQINEKNKNFRRGAGYKINQLIYKNQ